MKRHDEEFAIERMSELLNVSRSGYYAWNKRVSSSRQISNQRLDENIKKIFDRHRGRYGSPRITDELKALGKNCSENRVARRMQALGLYAKSKRKFKMTTDSNHDLPVAPNLLKQDFSASAPNQKWVSDISYIATSEGWLYMAVIIDLYSRAVIGWSMHERMTQDLVCNALKMALWRRGFPRNVIIHSDRGSQYCANNYQNLLEYYGLKCSMSRVGNCYDNAVAESFFHTIKTELIYQQNYETREQAKRSIFDYIEIYYNRNRRHSSIGSQSPWVFENQFKNIAGVCL